MFIIVAVISFVIEKKTYLNSKAFGSFSLLKKRPIRTHYLFGWGTWIRTRELSESEADALPLGDTPISRRDELQRHQGLLLGE